MTHHWATWANLLTFIRFALLIPFVYSLLNAQWLVTAILFTTAVITDIYDGKVARRLQQTSPAGGLFDHATDAAFVTLGCWALAQIGLINQFLPWVIPAAFVQYMLDSRALHGVALRTSVIGRINGIAYFVLLGTAVGAELLAWQVLREPIGWAAWLLVMSTLVSMGDRTITLLKLRQVR